MRYLRIPRNKFWGWVAFSFVAGLGVGLVVMLVRTSALGDQILILQNRLGSVSAETSGTSAPLQARLASAEASVTALTQQNAQLTAQLGSGQSTAAGTSTSPGGAVSVTSRSVSPSSVTASGTITMTVRVNGHPDKVQMRVVGTSGVSFDITYNLKRVTSGSTETWRRSVKAPSRRGTYRYEASAFVSGQRISMGGTSGYTFQVR
jgi:hypothetical protein